MLNKIKILPLLLCSGFVLQACNSSNDEQNSANAPKQMTYVGPTVYDAANERCQPMKREPTESQNYLRQLKRLCLRREARASYVMSP